jgi:hypothetical protein
MLGARGDDAAENLAFDVGRFRVEIWEVSEFSGHTVIAHSYTTEVEDGSTVIHKNSGSRLASP